NRTDGSAARAAGRRSDSAASAAACGGDDRRSRYLLDAVTARRQRLIAPERDALAMAAGDGLPGGSAHAAQIVVQVRRDEHARAARRQIGQLAEQLLGAPAQRRQRSGARA